VTRAAVHELAELYCVLVDRGVPAAPARDFVLCSAATMLAEGAGLPIELSLPSGEEGPHLTAAERERLARAASEDWSTTHPFVLGTLLEATAGSGERHARGAHYTPEASILEHVVRPTLLDPLRARLRESSTVDDLLALHEAVAGVRVLDPACASGNFLYVACRELARFEASLLSKMKESGAGAGRIRVSARQFFGIDIDPLAVELCRLTLALAENLWRARGLEAPAPRLDDLAANVRCDDALFCAWPAADLILGNPPFLSKNKMQQELGPSYVRRVRERYPGVPGRADYCVYWFRRAHDELPPGGRAGLVGTNTIRQNFSRAGGLDHVVGRGGTITEAVSTMEWPGDAVVHVSIVNWVKGEAPGPKRLSWQRDGEREGRWETAMLRRIPASLSASVDVTSASPLRANVASGACFQGQTHGHEGFLLSAGEAGEMMRAAPENAEVVFPYLVGEELLTAPNGRPSRWVIDFHPRDQHEARRYEAPFRRVERLVLPARERAAALERARNASVARGNRHHEAFLRRWWQLGYPRAELVGKLGGIGRYVACSRVAKRPIFAFVSTAIRPGDALVVFLLEDDYSFGVLQSGLHWAWLTARSSTMKEDFRYTSSTVFDTFPWPDAPGAHQVAAVAAAAVAVRAVRRRLCERHALSLRALHASPEGPGRRPLDEAQAALDATVRAAYGMGPGEDPLAFLLALNHARAAREAEGAIGAGPGVPPGVEAAGLVSEDAVQPARL
jgi:hypothetical protein